jgi:hypothetical protein
LTFLADVEDTLEPVDLVVDEAAEGYGDSWKSPFAKF